MKKILNLFLALFVLTLSSNAFAYTAIDIGPGAAALEYAFDFGGYTQLDATNPANATGILTSFELYYKTNATGVIVGTFSGSDTTWNDRDYESIGNVTSGSKQTFTGKNCDVVINDVLGFYDTSGAWYCASSGGARKYYAGNAFGQGDLTYIQDAFKLSMYATGYTIPDAPTSVSATDNLTDKVTITWTKPVSQNVTGYRVYRDGGDVSGLLGDVATWDDTTGTVDVAYAYTVKAVNLAGLSAASSADNGTKISGGGVTFIPQIIMF